MTYAMAIAIREKEKLKYQQQMDKKYPKGVRVFQPRENAPEFIKGQIVINPNEFFEWLKANSDVLSEYKEQKQLKLTIMTRKDGQGWNVAVDTYKAKDDGLPF